MTARQTCFNEDHVTGMSAIGCRQAQPLLACAVLCLIAVLSIALPGSARADLFDSSNPLISAIEDKDRQEFSLNLVQGKRPTIRDSQGVPAIILAVETKDAFFVKGLLDAGARADDRPRRGDDRTALTRAAELGDDEMVRALLAAGADPDLPGIQNEAALLKAANLGHRNIVKALIDAGADLSTTDMTGRSALEVARRAGRVRIVSMLEAAGATH